MSFDTLLPNSIFLGLILVHRSVNLDYQATLNARKIHNEAIDRVSAAKLDATYAPVPNHFPQTHFSLA